LTARIALPSRGRLRDASLALLEHAGYATTAFREGGRSAVPADVEFIEMRPADAAAWLAAGRLTAAFISTDAAWEYEIETWPTVPLGIAKSDLVVACRDDAPYGRIEDLEGAAVASHLPNATARLFAARDTAVSIIPMGGALEGVCSAGLADAIVDLRETGASLARARLRVLETVRSCEGLFVHHPDHTDDIEDVEIRLEAALAARGRHYLLLHLPPERIGDLTELFHGLASPTVLPLAGRDDLVAVHLIVEESRLWERLGPLRGIGASGIVALRTDAILQ